MRRLIILLLSWVVLSGIDSNTLHALTGNYVNLEGIQKFQPGDDESWASPEYDDSHWMEIKVPGSWESQGVKSQKGMGWYRIKFRAPCFLKDIEPAVLLGRIGEADEVFLNGVKIGSEGALGKDYVSATKAERLYKIPPGLLRYDGLNVIAVRVMSLFLEGGILDGRTGLGNYKDLLIEKQGRDAKRKTTETVFITILFISMILSLFMFVTHTGKKEFFYLALFFLLMNAFFVFDSLIFYLAGLKTHFIQKVFIAIPLTFPSVRLVFVTSINRFRLNNLLRVAILLSVTVAVSIVIIPYIHLNGKLLQFIWIVFFLLIGGAGLYYSIRACLMRHHESFPVLLGHSSFIFGGLIFMAGILDIHYFDKQALMWFLEIFGFMTMLYAVATRFGRLQREAMTLSERILTSQEEERRRISMEIHDGIGQSLMAVKLKLQMMNANNPCDVTKEIISEISDSIAELRDISHGLSPSFLEKMSLVEAIRWYGKKFEDKTGIKVRINSDLVIETSPKIKDNLYRIYQEALQNVFKHSGSSMVDVKIKRADGSLRMEIKDYGKGFSHVDKTKGGIGLSTMRQRAEIMGGIFSASSSKGQGVVISVEVPFND